jgi:predicted GIY-YIG superfamily endonuclease
MEDKLYVLQLENGKYYVGKTADVKKRFEQHVSGKGAEWTKIHRPVKLLETRRITSEHDENNTTKDLMKKYGMENVRGGAYSTTDISPEVEDVLRLEMKSNTNACYKCGKSGHISKYCSRKTSFKGTCHCGREFLIFEEFMSHNRMCVRRSVREDDVATPTKDVICYRCHRKGHYSNNCYAYTSKDGDYIGKPRRDFQRDWSDDDSD